MKKLIAMLFVVSLCVPSIFGQGAEHSIYSVNYGSFTSVALTITSSPCDVAYIVVDSTGLATDATVRILNGGTTVFALTLGSTLKTVTIDLTNTPVYFGTSLIVDASSMAAVANVTIVYRKRN